VDGRGSRDVATALRDLPRYLVLEPASTVRIDLGLDAPACEIDVELEQPMPGRSFVLLLGPPGGPFAQRVRLSGRARIFFDPETPGRYELLLANPQREPLVLHLRGREVRATSARPAALSRSVSAARPARPSRTAMPGRHRPAPRRHARAGPRGRAE